MENGLDSYKEFFGCRYLHCFRIPFIILMFFLRFTGLGICAKIASGLDIMQENALMWPSVTIAVFQGNFIYYLKEQWTSQLLKKWTLPSNDTGTNRTITSCPFDAFYSGLGLQPNQINMNSQVLKNMNGSLLKLGKT